MFNRFLLALKVLNFVWNIIFCHSPPLRTYLTKKQSNLNYSKCNKMRLMEHQRDRFAQCPCFTDEKAKK